MHSNQSSIEFGESTDKMVNDRPARSWSVVDNLALLDISIAHEEEFILVIDTSTIAREAIDLEPFLASLRDCKLCILMGPHSAELEETIDDLICERGAHSDVFFPTIIVSNSSDLIATANSWGGEDPIKVILLSKQSEISEIFPNGFDEIGV